MTRPAIPRREALRRLGLLAGGALSASTVAGVLAGCADRDAAGYAFRALDRKQHALTDTLADLILPATDTPGAREAGVPAFIDTLLADWMEDAERDRFLAGLADIDARANTAHGKRFVDLAPEQQTALLTVLDAEAYPETPAAPEQDATAAAAGNALGGADAMQDAAAATVGQPDTTAAPEAPAAEAPAEEPPPPFFSTLKELTLAGYYTSEIGATQELHWNAAPGRFDADLPLANVGRTWA